MPVSTKAVVSKRYGAKMNRLFHCGRVQNLIYTIPLYRNKQGSSPQAWYTVPSSGISIVMSQLLPLEMFYLKRYYQSFKLHQFKVTATIYSASVPANAQSLPCRLSIAADYLYRSKFFTTNIIDDANQSLTGNGFVDYADMMELPNVRSRDVLLSNLNNGSSISIVVKPARGCINPNISTDRLVVGSHQAIPDYDTEHGNVISNGISKTSDRVYHGMISGATLREQISNELMAYYFPVIYLGVTCPWISFGQVSSVPDYNIKVLLNVQVSYSMNGYVYTQDYQGIDPIPSITGDSSIITKPVTVSTFKGFEDNIQDKMFMIPPQGITGMVAQGQFY